MRSHLIQITSKLTALARSGRIAAARQLFDEMSHRDTVTWNAMISGYSHLGIYNEAIYLFHLMRFTDTKPDHFSFTASITACAGSTDLRCGQKLHALALVSCHNSSSPVKNSLIDMYGKCFIPSDAETVFEEIEFKNEISWCSLLFAYVNSNSFENAHQVFDEMPQRVDIAWNTMISGYAQLGEIKSCFDLFKNMLENEIKPDQWTLSAIMSVCTDTRQFHQGCSIQSLVIKTGWSSSMESNNSILSFYTRLSDESDILKALNSINGATNRISWNVMIDAYMKIGDVEKALVAFSLAPNKNIVSWTSVITGFARNGLTKEAISYFTEMISTGLRPDNFVFGSVLNACSWLGALGFGSAVHALAFALGFVTRQYVGNSLINMYAKCGDIEGSVRAFDDVVETDIVSWNTMLFAFALHGRAKLALAIHGKMVVFGVKPDGGTFIGLLMACNHSGLIETGRALFESMSSVYRLSPGFDHTTCVVNMIGRGGYLEEAKDLSLAVDKHMGGDVSPFEGVLGWCLAHGDVRMGEELGQFGLPTEMRYVVLSNLYCGSGRWREAEDVREEMAKKGVKKTAGCSWIEVRNEVKVFVAGRASGPFMEKLCGILYFLECEMKNPCFVE